MKKRRSVQKIVIRRFIGYALGIWFSLVFLEALATALLSGFSWAAEWDIGEVTILPLDEWSESVFTIQIVLSVAWGLISILIFLLGIRFFGRDISRKVMEPVRRMSEGFREVSKGNLDISLDFETETEFKEMRDAFNLMARKLKDSEEKRLMMENERMRLFSNIAHDIKTPMTTITGYAGALADGIVKGADKQREYHLAIKAKSAQLNQLIDQLLSYSKLGAPEYQMRFERVDITELLRAACAALFGEIENKRMELELNLPDEPVFIKADSLELNRAVGNLLTNAIRHNPAGTLLSAGITEKAEAIEICVADSGEAIPNVVAGKMFEPFVSGSDSRVSGSGTGLGLTIVKKIAERHGGDVFLSDAPAPYTKMFVLRLPKGETHVQ